MAPKPPKNSFQRLYSVAQDQGGYFTAKQAEAAGFDERHHGYHVHAGNWIREHRAIYRLANYPSPERPDLILWWLWSFNRKGEPQGVYSHVTALSLYDLSDMMPAKLHMTVPPGFRRNSAIPKVLALHKESLQKGDTQTIQGIRATTPLRTLVDLLSEGTVEKGFLQQAVQQALSKGLLIRSRIENHQALKDLLRK